MQLTGLVTEQSRAIAWRVSCSLASAESEHGRRVAVPTSFYRCNKQNRECVPSFSSSPTFSVFWEISSCAMILNLYLHADSTTRLQYVTCERDCR
jgi:hypothetical protein